MNKRKRERNQKKNKKGIEKEKEIQIQYFSLLIEIDKENIQVKIINNKEKKEEIIELYNLHQQKYPINIEFDKNEIKVCQENVSDENGLKGFMKELFENPKELKKYSFNYQKNHYELLAESVFALVFYEFQKEIDKRGIYNEIEIIYLEEPNVEKKKEIIHRIKSSLINIGIPNRFISVDNYMIRPREEYYVNEEFKIKEILDNYQQYNIFIKEIERAKQQMEHVFDKELKKKEYLLHQIIDYNAFYSEKKDNN